LLERVIILVYSLYFFDNISRVYREEFGIKVIRIYSLFEIFTR